MFSVIHEGGHALYDTGSADDLAYTVLDGGVSMGIHESQSRFYENLLGRSRAFTGFVFPKLCELFPELGGHTAEEFYRAINKAEPSLIRTEADEVTYSLHVMVRYELEKRVMHGELKVQTCRASGTAFTRNTSASTCRTTSTAFCRTAIGRAAASATSRPTHSAAPTAHSCFAR